MYHTENPPNLRNVVLGKNSKVWLRLQQYAGVSECVTSAISHSEIVSFRFLPGDRVWVFSYSRVPADNLQLLAALHQAGVFEIVYVTSSSTIISSITSCYEYPRVKQQAEHYALSLPNTRVLTIGLMYDELAELPSGDNVATSFADLATFIQAPDWPDGDGRRKHLLRVVKKPFGSRFEQAAYRGYGVGLRLSGSKPCLLRPLDLLLRTVGWRWYGYVYLGNQLWISTI
jgi:hypothetical protein